jgi:hypothetical protein
VSERHPIVRAGLVIAAAAAALALWAGLTAAGADTTGTSGGNPRVVFTQTEGGGNGHHCHDHDGSNGGENTTPQPTNESSAV